VKEFIRLFCSSYVRLRRTLVLTVPSSPRSTRWNSQTVAVRAFPTWNTPLGNHEREGYPLFGVECSVGEDASQQPIVAMHSQIDSVDKPHHNLWRSAVQAAKPPFEMTLSHVLFKKSPRGEDSGVTSRRRRRQGRCLHNRRSSSSLLVLATSSPVEEFDLVRKPRSMSLCSATTAASHSSSEDEHESCNVEKRRRDSGYPLGAAAAKQVVAASNIEPPRLSFRPTKWFLASRDSDSTSRDVSPHYSDDEEEWSVWPGMMDYSQTIDTFPDGWATPQPTICHQPLSPPCCWRRVSRAAFVTLDPNDIVDLALPDAF
jgi:hypothetical protein